LAAVLLVAMGVGTAPTPARSSGTVRVVDGRIGDWTAASPLVAGATAIEAGELVHQDHIYDDTGAAGDRTAKQHSNTPSASSSGHFRYPTDTDGYADNAADIFQVRVAADDARVWFLAQLNALRRSDTTVVSAAFDVDGGDERRPWPHAAGVTAVGADVVVTLWGTAGDAVDLRTGATTPLPDVAVSTDDNAIEASFPRSVLGTAGEARVWVTSGLWDPAAAAYQAVPVGPPTADAPGNGTPLTTSRVWNVGFRAVESGPFQEAVQSAALRTADVTPFAQPVDIEGLASGIDVPWLPQPGRFYVALLDTEFAIPPLGEGVSYGGVPGRFAGLQRVHFEQAFQFLGRYQPYGVYLPSTWAPGRKLPGALALHGYGGSHSSYNQFPGFLADMGEAPPTVLVSPLARGSSFYADYGEREVLEILDDVERRWSVDPDQLFLTGYSMGGYGVYRLGSLHPDRFAGAVVWAGFSGEFVGTSYTTAPVFGSGGRDTANVGDPVRNLESFLHLPLLHLMGTNDNVVPITGQYAAPRRLGELGYRHRLDVYPGYEHLAFGLVDEWSEPRAWLGDRRRETAPRDVVLAVSEAWRDPALQPALGLPDASAWWVTRAEQRDGRDDYLTKGVVRATSRALAGATHEPAPTNGVGTDPVPHVQSGVAWTLGPALPTENRLDLDLVNIGELVVDLRRAELRAGSLVLAIRSDGPGRLQLEGPGGRTIAYAAGTEEITLAGHGEATKAVVQARTLAATGGQGPGGALATLALGILLLAVLRRSAQRAREISSPPA
jgi:predicted esterase